MKQVKEVIIVEGRYDKSTVSRTVAGAIIETSGFGILNNKDKIILLRKLAEKRGLIIFTDSDKAGFFIRGRLKSMLDGTNIKHAYIPDIKGREKRKKFPSNEGKLGVEGMTENTILRALYQAGATFTEDDPKSKSIPGITKTDFYTLGLSGGEGSRIKRRELLKKLDLPERLSANGLLDVLNILYSREEFMALYVSS